ncbi:MAG: YdeI/OmpD-associated family protein [Saprospiraceae bacterium]
MPDKELETFCPTSQAEWRAWLEKKHESRQSVWLIQYRTSSENASLTWSEAVDEALCFGWIDSTRRTIDGESFMQYFSKRKAKSNWSKINKEKVAELIQSKRMTDAGLRSIEIAKQNGSWNLLDEIEALVVPEDFQAELKAVQNAFKYFESLSKSKKKLVLHWVFAAKRPETRENRIQEISKAAREGKLPRQLGGG